MKNNQETDINPLIEAIKNVDHSQAQRLTHSGKYNNLIEQNRESISKAIENARKQLPYPKQAELGQIENRFKEFDTTQKVKSLNFKPASVEPKKDELSPENGSQEEFLRAAIRSNNIDTVQYYLNQPEFYDILVSKSNQIFRTVVYARAELTENSNLEAEERNQLQLGYDIISSVISSKIKDIKQGIDSFQEISLQDKPTKPLQPKELSEKTKEILNVITSKDPAKLTSLLDNKDSIAIIAKNYKAFEQVIDKEKAQLEKSNSTKELSTLTDIISKVIAGNSESNLITKIKSAIEDLINTIQKFFKSSDKKAPNENTKLLEGIRDNVKKYSISEVAESTPTSPPKTTSKPKSGEREL